MSEDVTYMVDTWSGIPRYLCLVCGTSTTGEQAAFVRLTDHIEAVHGVQAIRAVRASEEPTPPTPPPVPPTPEDPEGEPVLEEPEPLDKVPASAEA